MTLPYLPGWGDTLANMLPKLAQNLRGAINPNWQQQEAVQQQVLQNPQYAEQLAQLGRSNPQLFEQLKLGKVGQNILQTPESEAARIERETNTAKLKGAQAQTKLLENDVANIDFDNFLKNAKKKSLQFELQQLEETSAGFPGLKEKGINLSKLADAVISGEPSAEHIAYVYGNPQLKAAFDDMVQRKFGMKTLDLQERNANARLALSEKNADRRIKTEGDRSILQSLDKQLDNLRQEIASTMAEMKLPQNAIKDTDRTLSGNKTSEMGKQAAERIRINKELNDKLSLLRTQYSQYQSIFSNIAGGEEVKQKKGKLFNDYFKANPRATQEEIQNWVEQNWHKLGVQVPKGGIKL